MIDLKTRHMELHFVADELEGLLPIGDTANFRDLINHREVSIGLEMILEDIYEHNVVLSKKAYDILKKYCEEEEEDVYSPYFEVISYDEK